MFVLIMSKLKNVTQITDPCGIYDENVCIIYKMYSASFSDTLLTISSVVVLRLKNFSSK